MSQSASVDTQKYLLVGHPERTGSETEVTEFHLKFACLIRDVLHTDLVLHMTRDCMILLSSVGFITRNEMSFLSQGMMGKPDLQL